MYLGDINSRKLSLNPPEITKCFHKNNFDRVDVHQGRIFDKTECKITK